MINKAKRAAAFAAVFAALSGAPAGAEPVDLELVLATDNSSSIDYAEARLQREGVAAAFRSAEVVRAIRAGALGKIGVAYLDWSSEFYNTITVDWTVIHDAASATGFAEALLAAPPAYGEGTAIGSALELAALMMEANDLEGTLRTIDISGDGPNNRGRPVALVRNEIIERGITVNGLPIITYDYGNGDWGDYYGRIDEYYTNCVIGGRRSFALPAYGYQDFATAIRRKLVLELSGADPAAQFAQGATASPLPRMPLTAPNNQLRLENCISGYYGGFGDFR